MLSGECIKVELNRIQPSSLNSNINADIFCCQPDAEGFREKSYLTCTRLLIRATAVPSSHISYHFPINPFDSKPHTLLRMWRPCIYLAGFRAMQKVNLFQQENLLWRSFAWIVIISPLVTHYRPHIRYQICFFPRQSLCKDMLTSCKQWLSLCITVLITNLVATKWTLDHCTLHGSLSWPAFNRFLAR